MEVDGSKLRTVVPEPPLVSPQEPLRKLIPVAAIAAGVQFGWALQLSLLTPYVQLLGIPHAWAAFIWLCGPVSGLFVQPIVGHYSDNCSSRFGRRRPFIAAGAALVAIAVFLIGFAADIGHASGDPLGNDGKTAKPRAIAVFVVGFWILDVANNMLQVNYTRDYLKISTPYACGLNSHFLLKLKLKKKIGFNFFLLFMFSINLRR